jgi:hypothetical protein
MFIFLIFSVLFIAGIHWALMRVVDEAEYHGYTERTDYYRFEIEKNNRVNFF